MILKNRWKKTALTASVLVMAGAVPVFAAPSLSQPGQDIAAQAPAADAALDNQLPAQKAQGSEETKFTIKKLKLDAAELHLNEKDISEILSGCVGHEMTLKELHQKLAALTTYCREHGYPAAAAYLPAQQSDTGTVTVKIIPGRIGEVRLENHSKLKDSMARGLLKGLRKGDIIRSAKLETTLYSLSDVSGTKAVGVLSPGKEFGTSDVTVRIEDGKLQNTVLYMENYGSKGTGRYRYGLQESLYDLGGTGGKLNLGTLISNSRMHDYYASYETPVGHSAATLGLGFSRMDYTLGGPFRAYGATGSADTLSLFGSYPFYHLHDRSLKLTYGYDYRRLKDDMDRWGEAASSKKHSHSVHVGVEGSQSQPGLAVDYDAALTTGTLGADSDYARALSDQAGTSGHYTKLNADASAVKSLGHRADVLLKASAQTASHNLDGSEQITLGGANGVRAYPQGEGSGDQGILGTAEFRFYTGVPGLSFSSYFDIGHVKLAHSPTYEFNSGSMTLKGWGVAASYTMPGDWFARLDYARRIGSDPNMSEDAKAKGRVWFLLGKVW